MEKGPLAKNAALTGRWFVPPPDNLKSALCATPAGKEDNEGQNEGMTTGKKENVIIAGDSDLYRCSKAIRQRVKSDKRVAIGTFPGETLGFVMAWAKANLSGKAQVRNLVIVAGGLNDALNRQAGGIAQHLTKGMDDLRAVSPRVRIAVCTVPEVLLRDMAVQRAVPAANKAIWRMGCEKGFEVIEINREVHRWAVFKGMESTSTISLDKKWASDQQDAQ